MDTFYIERGTLEDFFYLYSLSVEAGLLLAFWGHARWTQAHRPATSINPRDRHHHLDLAWGKPWGAVFDEIRSPKWNTLVGLGGLQIKTLVSTPFLCIHEYLLVKRALKTIKVTSTACTFRKIKELSTEHIMHPIDLYVTVSKSSSRSLLRVTHVVKFWINSQVTFFCSLSTFPNKRFLFFHSDRLIRSWIGPESSILQ